MFSESSESLRRLHGSSARQLSTASSNKDGELSGSDDKQASLRDEEEDDGEDMGEPEEQDLEENTRFHVAQELETFDHPTYDDKHDKPMMEIVAASNVWYQATMLQSSWNEIRVLFPAVSKGDREVREWVHKNSSRIWRGSLKPKDWKYLGRGAWEPRSGKQQHLRPKAARKPKRRRVLGAQPPNKHPRVGSAHDDTGTGTGTSEGVTGQVQRVVEDDAASPRALLHVRRPHRPPRGRSPSGATQPQEQPPLEEHPHPCARPAAEASSSKGALERKFADSAGNAGGPSDAATSADPLTHWFHLHFTLLHRKGLLGRHSILDSPEAGCLPLPSIKPESKVLPVLPSTQLHSASVCSLEHLPGRGSNPGGAQGAGAPGPSVRDLKPRGSGAGGPVKKVSDKRSDDNTSPRSRGSGPPRSGSGGRHTGLRELQGLAPWGWERVRPEGEQSSDAGDQPDRHSESDDEQPCPIRNRPHTAPTRRAAAGRGRTTQHYSIEARQKVTFTDTQQQR